MLKLILYAFLIWFLYNLIFKFIIPVYRTSSQLKKKFREMSEQMNQQRGAQPEKDAIPPQNGKSGNPGTKAGDYIDFEEVR